MLAFARAISEPEAGFLDEETIASRTADAIDHYGVYRVGRGVFSYHGFGAGTFWGHAGSGMSSHSSMVAYDPVSGAAAAVHTNLDTAFIPNDYQLHWDVLGAIGEHFTAGDGG